MQKFDITKVDNETPLSVEEGCEFTKFYVNYYWRTNKYYSLKDQYEEDDIVNELICKFLRLNAFDKYDSTKTSKKYYCMRIVQTSMIDLLRKYRETLSLNRESGIETGLTFEDLVEDEGIGVENEASGSADRDRIINQLPNSTRSAIRGFSPLMGKEVGIDYRTLALHMEAGYTVKDLAKMYVNPNSGQNISEGSVSRYISEMREYILDNIVIC